MQDPAIVESKQQIFALRSDALDDVPRELGFGNRWHG
jgi:hypothetical protein